VNEYLHSIAGREITAKDFRTWAGTVLVAEALAAHGCCATQTEIKRAVVEAIDATAAQLRNTRAVCRSSYMHPAILEAYEDGVTISDIARRPRRTITGMQPEEQFVLALLRRGERQLRKAA
jgi:DNA topoisomerase-1